MPRGAVAPPNSGSRFWGCATFALALITALGAFGPACSTDVTRVRLEFRIENDGFRPEYVWISWQTGGKQRQARVPAQGSFTPKNDVLGSALISLDEKDIIERRFTARGYRGPDKPGATKDEKFEGKTQVSGAVVNVPFSKGRESSVTMMLGCYDDPDPEVARLPACGGTPPRPDAGSDTGGGDSAGDAPADLAGDRPGDGSG